MMSFINRICIKILDRLVIFVNSPVFAVKHYYYRKKLKVEQLDIYFPIFISNIDNLELGENCAINSFVHIWANEKVTIGENSMIAAHVQIFTSTHDYRYKPYRSQRVDSPITIGNNVWVGSGAIIMPGITIGNNSVIGAGSVVTRDIPANSLAYGVPAKVIKNLISKTEINE